jgi:hypothetical protein
LEAARELLADDALMILSTYAVGYSPLAFANLLHEFGEGRVEAGELALQEAPAERGATAPSPNPGTDRLLPAGFCARYWKGSLA